MKSPVLLKFLSLTAIALFLAVTSCKDEDAISFSSDDNSNLQSEASTDAQLEDLSDLAGVAMLADAGTSTGSRIAGASREITGIVDARFGCATVTLEFAGDNNPNSPATIHGTIVIDFGDGCTGPNGRVRKGRINIEFIGKRFYPGSMVIISTEDYFVDGIGVDGVRTELNSSSSNEDAPSFTINESVTLIFPDGTTATRESTRTRTWHREANPLQDSWTVTGSAIGTTRRDVEYVMTITKPLVFKRECAILSKLVIPVEGTKELVVNDKKITTDFGNGECDTKITITINGKSKDIEISANAD